MKKYILAASVIALASFTPAIASAAGFNGGALGEYLAGIVDFINSYLIPLIFALAFIVFLWGVFQYFIAGGANEEQRDKGKQLVMWGIIGFVVMMCLWGIVNLLVETLDFGGQNAPELPGFHPGGTNTNGNTPPPAWNPDDGA